jgi:hypothetical protein
MERLMSTLPTVLSASGAVPLTPLFIQQQLIDNVLSTNPGVVATLPGSMLDDITGTNVASIALCDHAKVDLINSLTPYGANSFLLTQLGNIYGVHIGIASNGSVYCLFTGTPGFVIGVGFTVSDGSHQYSVQDGGIVSTDGTVSLYCVATVSGSWAIPPGTVTTFITSVPSTITLTVTNPNAGIPSAGAQSLESFRAQVLQAGIAPSIGSMTYCKAQIQNVPGTINRLVSIQQANTVYRIIVGGGDPYSVAYAIFKSLFNFGNFVGSESIAISGITKANPGIVDTYPIVHGLITGQLGIFTGIVGMTELNNVTAPEYSIVVLSPYTFSLERAGTPVDTSSYTPYSSGGFFIPDTGSAYTQTITIQDYPDNYQVTFVTPPLQQLGMIVNWRTSQPNFTSDVAIAQLAIPALISYVNGLPVGYTVNALELQYIFITAITPILASQYVSAVTFSFTLNGRVAIPIGNVLVGDPQGYFNTDSASIKVIQG